MAKRTSRQAPELLPSGKTSELDPSGKTSELDPPGKTQIATILELPEGGFQVSYPELDLTAAAETLEEAFCRLQKLKALRGPARKD